MRLIDADKLETTAVLGVQLQHADSRYYYFYEEGTIDNAPTVKAIPIEWILNYRKNNQGEITYYTIDAIDHMLCEWCKRNNIDMWDMIDSWEKENEID